MIFQHINDLHLEHFFKELPIVQQKFNQSTIFTVSKTPLSNAKILMNTSSCFNYYGDISEIGSISQYEFTEEQIERERQGFAKFIQNEMQDIAFDILRSGLDFLDSIQQPQTISSINLNYLNIMRQKVGNDALVIMDKFTKCKLFGAESMKNESEEHLFKIDSITYELPIVTLKRKIGFGIPDTHRYVYIIKKDLFNLYFYPVKNYHEKHAFLNVEETDHYLPIVVDVEIKGFDYIYGQFLQNNLENCLFISCQIA